MSLEIEKNFWRRINSIFKSIHEWKAYHEVHRHSTEPTRELSVIDIELIDFLPQKLKEEMFQLRSVNFFAVSQLGPLLLVPFLHRFVLVDRKFCVLFPILPLFFDPAKDFSLFLLVHFNFQNNGIMTMSSHFVAFQDHFCHFLRRLERFPAFVAQFSLAFVPFVHVFAKLAK